MKQDIFIEGMTCESCVDKMKKLFGELAGVSEVIVNLEEKKVSLSIEQKLTSYEVQKLLQPFPKYKLAEPTQEITLESTQTKLQTFKPLILVFLFISLVSVLSAMKPSGFSFYYWMNYFMAGFFLVFSFFKFLDIPSFADSFQMYDLLANRSRFYALIYPFIELSLGVAYLTEFKPIFTNWATLVVMGFGTLGVIKSVFSKTTIKCACLGTIWNLPMTTVTIIENMLMVCMAFYMLMIM